MLTLPVWVWRLSILGLAALMPIAGFVAVRTLDDRRTLHDGTAAMTAIVDETLGALGPGRQITLNRVNVPDPPFVRQEDRLDYDQCDYWWSIVLPGWEAGLSYTVPTHGEQDRAVVFATVRALWSTYGGELTGDIAANGGLALDLDHSHYRMYVGQMFHEIVLSGATHCLPR